MHSAQRFARALPLSVLLLAGCGKSGEVLAPTSQTDAEQTTATEEVARHPELVEEGMYESDSQAPVTSAEDAGAQVLAAIRPLFFWRQITHVERAFEFAFSDPDSNGQPTTAIVTVHKRLSGSFNVVAADAATEGSPTEGHLVRKELHDHWVRRLLLKRLPDADEHRPWRIAATSGVEVTSRDAQTRIQSLRIQSGTLDTTITDVRAFFRLRRLLHLELDVDVTLTATTGQADDVVILYLGERRLRFANQGGGTYTATWHTAAFEGVRHFGVNALSHGTLFDDAAPYDSQAWILPFVVGSTEMADLAL